MNPPFTRLVRAGLREALASVYVRAARAKGLPGGWVVRHALGNVMLPLVTVIGSRVGMFLSGAVLVEVVFAWPGLGMLLVISFAVVLANLLTDLAYAWRPRHRAAPATRGGSSAR